MEGGQPSERTEIRVIFDENNLYIGAIIYDDPSQILAFQRERDASLGTDDRFMWILDTFLDGRTGYFFEINAAGLMGDGVIGAGGGRGGRVCTTGGRIVDATGDSSINGLRSLQELAPYGIATFHRLLRRLRAYPSAGLDEDMLSGTLYGMSSPGQRA